MNITKDIIAEINPVASLIVYEHGYIETCLIKKGKFGPRKPLTIQALKKLKELFSFSKEEKKASFKGYISSDLIYLNADVSNPTVVWKSNPQFRILLMAGIEKKRVHMPFMIWCYSQGRLHVFAAKKMHKDISQTKLYHVPFPNIVGKSSVCFGNVKLNEEHESIDDIMQEYEHAFFNSYFTEPDEHNKEYWQKATDQAFDYTILKPCKHYGKLKDFINAIERNTLD